MSRLRCSPVLPDSDPVLNIFTQCPLRLLEMSSASLTSLAPAWGYEYASLRAPEAPSARADSCIPIAVTHAGHRGTRQRRSKTERDK